MSTKYRDGSVTELFDLRQRDSIRDLS